MIVAGTALVIALGGSAAAASGKWWVDTGDIQPGAVTTNKIRNGAVTADKLDRGTVNGDNVARRTLAGRHLKSDSVGTRQLSTVPAVRVMPTWKSYLPIPDGSSEGSSVALTWTINKASKMFNQYETGNPFSAGQATRLTAPESGLYAISGGVRWAPIESGPQIAQLSIVANGTQTLGQESFVPTLNLVQAQDIATTALLDEGDYVELEAFQMSESQNTQTIESQGAHFEMTWVAPAP